MTCFTSPSVKQRSAWITISGKVFVDRYEILDKLNELYPDIEVVSDDMDALDVCTVAQEEEAFYAAAQEKISRHFLNDEPIKHYETEIDLSTIG